MNIKGPLTDFFKHFREIRNNILFMYDNDNGGKWNDLKIKISIEEYNKYNYNSY